jgi:FkbM family methyltransferase
LKSCLEPGLIGPIIAKHELPAATCAMNTDNPNRESPPLENNDKTCQLPNGMTVYHLNKHETDFLYKEIFAERSYIRNGITLDSKACVFDIGANIGLFSLFVKTECADASVYAFEPAPELNRILKLNVSRHGDSVKVFPYGMSDAEGEAVFTYYADYSILSGLHANASEDADVLASGIRHQLAAGRAKIVEGADEYVNRLVQKKLGNKTETKCTLKTVSGMIREAGIQQIDLLKIDAEKSELAILRGIQEADWPGIKQIVMEIHSLKEVEQITPMLQLKGFKIKLEKEDQFENSEVFNAFAIRA